MAAVSDLMSIGGGIIWNLVRTFLIVAFSVALFFIVRWIQKGTKKQKAFTTQSVIVDLNGVIDLDWLALVKSEESGLLEMVFKGRKSDSIPPVPKHLVKNGLVMLLNYAPGHYCVIDTSETMYHFNHGKWEIVPFNLGMKKYITSKHREIINKAESKKKKWETYAPWITLGVAVISAAILSAVLFFAGAKLEAANIAQRIAECGG